MSLLRRRWLRILAALAIVCLGAAAALGLYLRSAAFQRRAETFLIAQMRQAAGVRVSMRGFHLQLFPIRIEMDQVVIHGRESAAQAPLAVLPHVDVRLRLISLWRREIRLRSLELQQPRFAVYELTDGALNLPQPDLPWLRRQEEAQVLFAISAQHVGIAGGTIAWQDRTIPLSMQLRQVRLRLDAVDAAQAPGQARRAAFAGELEFTNDIAVAQLPRQNVTVSARFTLWPDALRLDRGLARAAGVQATASGWLRNFTAPELSLQYQAEAGLASLAGVTPSLIHGLDGSVGVRGNWQWSPRAWSAQADVQVRRIHGQPEWGSWNGQATLTAGPSGLHIASLELHGLGASIRAHGDDDAWRGLLLSGDFENLRLAALDPLLRPMLPGPAGPVLLHSFAASASGTAQLRFRRETLGTVDLTTRLRPLAAPGSLPLAGTVQVHLNPATHALAITTLNLRSGANQLAVRGSVAPARGSLTYSFTSSDLASLRPIAQAINAHLGSGRTLPDFGGAVQLQGTLQGDPQAPVVTSSLHATTARWGPWTADTLDAQVSLGPEALVLRRLVYRQGRQSAELSGTIALQQYRLLPNSTLSLRGTLRGIDVAHALRAAQLPNLPRVTGTLDASAEAYGTYADPDIRGKAALAHAQWHGQNLRAATAECTLLHAQLTCPQFSVVLAHTTVQGDFALGLRDHRYQIRASSSGVELADIALLQSPRLALHGRLRFQVAGAGSLDDPQGTLTLATSGLRGGGESLGDVAAKLTLQGHQVAFQTADILTNGSFNLSGSVGTQAPYPAQAQLHLRDYDFDAFLRRFTPADVTGHSRVSGTAQLSGPLAEPDQMRATLDLDPVAVALNGLVIHNQGPVHLTAGAQRLALTPAHIVGPDTDFILQGSLALGPNLRHFFAGDSAATGQLSGSINLALLHLVHPATQASGEITVSAALAGTLRAPRLSGTLHIANGTLAEARLPIAFDHIQGALRLDGNRVEIANLTAETGSGTLAIHGYGVRTAQGVSYNVTFRGQNLRLRYRGISTSGNLQLRLSGNQRQALLAGDAQLTRVALDPGFDLALLIASLQQNPPLPNPDSLLSRVRMDIHLVTGPQVQVATTEAHLQLQADLRLRGSMADPSVLGQAGASEGRLTFAGNEFRITKAQVQFANPFRIEPLLDVGLATTVQQYDITIDLSGPVDKMAISYRSDPPLSSSDVVALLATGEPTQATASLTAAGNFAPSEQLLGQALNNLVASRLHRLFGITRLQVNPNTGPLGPTGNGGSITVEQQVSRNVKLTYTHNLASSSQDIVQVDWTISRFWGITLARDQFGLYGLKFTFRHRAH